MTAEPDLPLIVARMISINESFQGQRLPHAFGGALALAWCTHRARGTIDIDVNVFVEQSAAASVFEALPTDIVRGPDELDRACRDGQVRLWWDTTPIDLFLDVSPFHRDAAGRVVVHRLGGRDLPFLACSDLAVFKAFFNRTKDWADIEEMLDAGTLDIDRVVGVLVRYLGPDDERVGRLLGLVAGAIE